MKLTTVAHIEEPTRVTASHATILDQFISNVPDFIKRTSVEAPVSTNDHCTIGLYLLFRIRKKKAYSRLIWDFNHTNWDNFREALENAELEKCTESNDINISCEQLTNRIMEIAKHIIPNKTITIRPNDKPWYTEDLRRQRRIKDRLYQKAKTKKTVAAWTLFNQTRNLYYQGIKNAKQQYDSTKYTLLVDEGKRNSKKWWHILKSLLGQTSDSEIPPLLCDLEIITDDKEKASAFNNFFAGAAQLDDTNAELPVLDHYDGPILEDITVTRQDVMDQLIALDTSKAYGPDGLSPKLLKEGRLAIAPVLCKLYNKSLHACSVPHLWKRANVIPIHKKGKRELMNNYRPVSLISSGAKIFEKIVFKYIFNHFKDNFLISLWQSGFLPGRSTVTQLTELYHSFCKAVADGKEVRVVFLDISKAFDRVWHKGLLTKLHNFGIRGRLLDWFTDYLKERYQRVVLSGQCSDWAELKSGVPQGAVLGPLLFLVFINDIVYVVRHCKIRMFADDTCLFIEVDNREEAAANINDDMDSISN